MKAVDAAISMVTGAWERRKPEVSTGAKVATDSKVLPSVEALTQRAAPQDMNAAVRAAAAQIDSYLKSVGREVEFRVDEETGTTVVTVRETASGEVIRQIPNEEVLQMARRFQAGSGAVLDLTV
ncbi:MAG: flagellar protein FlaG [Povalibacter sp.]